jgi:hypothetical protein
VDPDSRGSVGRLEKARESTLDASQRLESARQLMLVGEDQLVVDTVDVPGEMLAEETPFFRG